MYRSIFLLLVFTYLPSMAFAEKVDYVLNMDNPHTHYFEVTMLIGEIKGKEVNVKMPVWAPGSYLVREFPRGVNIVKAYEGVDRSETKELTVKKTDKSTWNIKTNGAKSITVRYQVYSYELSVRTSFLDDSHGYVNGTSIFMYTDGSKEANGTLVIQPHKNFTKVSTALERSTEVGHQKFTYHFKDYDELADCPIEIGNQEEFTFDAAGVKHTVAMYGPGNYDIPTLQRDMKKIVKAATMVFGENPNKEYLFIVHNLTNPSGGLEHKASTTLQVNRWTYEGSAYLGFLSLVAHEYFHLWNVKRIRPKELGPFDYTKENYTDLLWVMEGFTSYYDELLLRRAGFYTDEEYLGKIMGTINYVENSVGNGVQPVAHSSFDAWIKAYRRNENSGNTEISYYSKGQVLAALLDLYIINKFKGEKCLDHFMQKLWADYYIKSDVGFTEEEFQGSLEEFVGEDLAWFFDDYVYGTKTPDYPKFFKGLGLDLFDSVTGQEAYIGIRVGNSGGKLIINTVNSNQTGELYGLNVDDEIIAVDGFRVNKADFDKMMASKGIGDEFEVMISRDNIIKTYKVTMSGRLTKKYQYIPKLEGEAKKNYDYWLRVDVK